MNNDLNYGFRLPKPHRKTRILHLFIIFVRFINICGLTWHLSFATHFVKILTIHPAIERVATAVPLIRHHMDNVI